MISMFIGRCNTQIQSNDARAGGFRGGLNSQKGVNEMDKVFTLMAALYTGMYDRDESEDRGAGMVEYALLVALVGVLLVAALTGLKDGIAGAFADAVSKL